MARAIQKAIRDLEAQNRAIAAFGDLLDGIESMEDKRKFLWKQVYENAITDRELAHQMLSGAMGEVEKEPGMHVSMGANISKYIERMSRATDQIIKLSEMVQCVMDSEASAKDEAMGDIYARISAASGK